MKLDDFVCTKCGECCRHIDNVEGLRRLQTNGVCKYLKDDLCSIYKIRPRLCRREDVYEMFKNVMSEGEFTKLIIQCCNQLKAMKK